MAQLDRRLQPLITDMRLPDGTGLDLLRRLQVGLARARDRDHGLRPAENAVRRSRPGPDYLPKPVDPKQFRAVVTASAPAAARRRRPCSRRRCPVENRCPPVSAPASPEAAPAAPVSARQPGAPRAWPVRCGREAGPFDDRPVARSMAPVLVSGESGAGKELVARAVHEVSPAGSPLIAVNCKARSQTTAGGRVLRLPQGRVHRCRRRPRGASSRRPTAAPVPRRDRRPAAGDAVRCCAIQERRSGRWGGQRARGQRAHPERHAQGPGLRGGAVPALPVGPVLPPQRHPDHDAATARERLEDPLAIAERVLERIAQDAGRRSAATPDARRHSCTAPLPLPGNVRSSRTCCTGPWRCRVGTPSPSRISRCPMPSSAMARRGVRPARRGHGARACCAGRRAADRPGLARRGRPRHPVRALDIGTEGNRTAPGPDSSPAADALPHGAWGRHVRRRRPSAATAREGRFPEPPPWLPWRVVW